MIDSAIPSAPRSPLGVPIVSEGGDSANNASSSAVAPGDVFGALLIRQIGLAPEAASSGQGVLLAGQLDLASIVAASGQDADDVVPGQIPSPESLFGSALMEQLGRAAKPEVPVVLGVPNMPGITEVEPGKPDEVTEDTGVSDAAQYRMSGMLQPLIQTPPSLIAAAIPDRFSNGLPDVVAPLSLVTAPSVALFSTPVRMQSASASIIATSAALGTEVDVSLASSSLRQFGEEAILKWQETAAGERQFAALPLKNAVMGMDNKLQPDIAPDSMRLSLGIPVAAGTITRQDMTPSQINSTLPSSFINAPVASGAWGASLGEKVVWMVGQQHHGVELRLNPPALGPLEVRVSVSDGQANLSFMTQHLPVRDAIESATSRLREMLGESGIGLGSVSVNLGTFAQQQQSSGDPNSGRHESSFARWHAGTNTTSILPMDLTLRQQHANGLVDTFA